ncbi:hypothetical protein [Fictibacillus enclensis]|uniref:hypothetical protein n=1 Tax=Fictibacillus enclensis TaxID=1017270 RepID=UPI0024C0AE02|nr:hypothetical protein [Fictibacillus enclensis]WHY71190.1 hypothetical protein QNH15_19540 [Fictibacillus enclensis]
MNNETYLDFCFIRTFGVFEESLFSKVDKALQHLFDHQLLHWYLEEKKKDGLEIVIAEVRGMSEWTSEDEVLNHLEKAEGSSFWEYLQGCQFNVYPAMKGCGSCGT